MTEVPSRLEPISVPQAVLAEAGAGAVPVHTSSLRGPARNDRPVCAAVGPAAAIEPDVATSSSTPGRTPHE
jgi:hypothetical protein